MRNASCAIIKLGFTDNDARRRASAGVVRTRRTCECFCIARQRFQHDHLSMGLVSRKGCDDGIRTDCGHLLRYVLEQAFNETRVMPVSLIEQSLHQQRFLRARETSFLPGL